MIFSPSFKRSLTALFCSAAILFSVQNVNAKDAAITNAKETVVKIGLTAAIYEDIWDPIAKELAKEGIKLEYVQFNNFSLPNQALANGEIELNAFQHHAFLRNEIKNNGFKISAIGDTYIIAMNIYSRKVKSLNELKDGCKVALPNDVTNEGRAIKLLESAGLLTVDPKAGATPELTDIKSTKVKMDFVEIDANLVHSVLPDVDIAVINGNYALDAGMKADEALYKEQKYENDNYICLIACRTEDVNNPVYKRVVKAYQTQKTIDIFNSTFAGFFVPAWK